MGPVEGANGPSVARERDFLLGKALGQEESPRVGQLLLIKDRYSVHHIGTRCIG